jgi:hypothetical protein
MDHRGAKRASTDADPEDHWSPEQTAAYDAAVAAEFGTRARNGDVIRWQSLAAAKAHASTPGARRLGTRVVFRLRGSGAWTEYRPPTPAGPSLPAQIAAIERAIPGLVRDVRSLIPRGADGRFASDD